MKKLLTIVLFVFAALGLAACGGGEEPAASNGGGSGGGEAAPTELSFVGTDIAFDKTEATAAANTQVTVDFVNEGSLEHNVIIASAGVDPLEATEEDALGGASTGIVGAGGEAGFTFNLPAGEYQYICTVPGHAAAGMVGTLTLEE